MNIKNKYLRGRKRQYGVLVKPSAKNKDSDIKKIVKENYINGLTIKNARILHLKDKLYICNKIKWIGGRS